MGGLVEKLVSKEGKQLTQGRTGDAFSLNSSLRLPERTGLYSSCFCLLPRFRCVVFLFVAFLFWLSWRECLHGRKETHN